LLGQTCVPFEKLTDSAKKSSNRDVAFRIMREADRSRHSFIDVGGLVDAARMLNLAGDFLLARAMEEKNKSTGRGRGNQF
jgi:hypothetical protein